MAARNIPTDKKQLRACLLCSQVKNMTQFRRDGCSNCEEILALRGSSDKVQECTSATFDGLVAMAAPTESWVARWQRTDKFTPGMYAVKVSGQLPEYIRDELARRGIQYTPRDGNHDV